MPQRESRAGPRASPSLRLDTPVKFLKGIGERRAEQLERLGIRTARDLLWHLPHRYVDASTVTPLAKAEIGQEVACVGRVVAKGVLPTRRGLRIFHAVLRDDSGVLECVWPGQAFLDRTIDVGQTLLVSGPVRFYHGRQMAPREFVILADAGRRGRSPGRGEGAAGLSRHRGPEPQDHSRSLIDRHLDALIALSEDVLPEALRAAAGLPALAEALRAVHRPRVGRGGGAGPPAARLRRAARSPAHADPRPHRRQAAAERGRLRGQARPHHPAAGAPALAAHRRPAAGAPRDHRAT